MEKQFLLKIQTISENDFSRIVVEPLYSEIYSSRVEFLGITSPEKGRDLVVYRSDAFGDPDFIGIQVKKIKVDASATSKGFQSLKLQISQMHDEGVVIPTTGEQCKFRSYHFVTPFVIGDIINDSHTGAIKDLSKRGIKIVDGKSLFRQIEKYCPTIFKELLGGGRIIGTSVRPHLTNRLLMNSLNQTKVKALSEIYCDTHFVAGNKKELEKISSSYSPSDLTLLEVSASNIDDVIEVIRSINQLVEGVVANPHTLLEYKDLLEKREFLKKDIDSKGSEIESIRTVIKTTIEKSDIKILYPDVNDYKKFIHFINIGFKNLLEQSTEPFLLLSEIKVIKEKYELQQQLIIQNQDNRKNIEGMSKTHSISVNTTLFTRQLNSKISDFKSTVINENIDLSGYFNLSKELDLLFIFVEQFATLFNIGADAMPFGLKTVKIKLEDAFNLGRNTIVLGEAGSGKTTNLQYYADRCYRNNEDKLIVYSTLNKLASLSTAASLDPILNGLSNILEDYTGTFYSETSLDKTLKSDGAIFILDSVDEAISSYSWIVKKLALFARKYPNCQIITSSRFPVKDLKNLDFVKISLLPFDDKQKEVFFKNWFKDDIKKASFIMRHLEENPKLNKIVTNPLSATIMAILQDNKVDLPVSEYSLYQKRFELLSGVFDKHKGIIRMRNDPERLISSARKIAFEMHSQHERSLDSNLMVAFLGFKYGDEAEAIVEELISPAEILHLEADGSYTFGHLRFQEYLASEHINHARNTTPKYFYKDSWWHDTLILYSQHAEQIEWIVNSILTSESAVTFKALISNMISVRPLIERQKLTSRLEIALADERDELGNSGTFADFEPSPDEY